MSKVSIFTPTHRPDWIFDAWNSITSQKGDIDWQWVLVPNAGAEIPPAIRDDPRVKVIPCSFPTPSVGALKSFALQHCDGRIAIELDHDDILLPYCLREVHKALKDGGNKFFYAPTIETKTINGKTEDILYNGCGWQHCKWKDHLHNKHEYNLPWEVNPRTLYNLLAAPNHPRAFTMEAYEKSGGYDPLLATADDLDLMQRMYLSGTEFIKHDEPLYWQRMRASDNTQYQFYEGNQQRQRELGHARIIPMIHEWCRREGLLKLDLGGALGPKEGFMTVDKRPNSGIQCDISQGLPFEDNSCGFIWASDFMEHIPHDKIPHVVNEIWRCLKHGGFWYAHTPSVDNPDGTVGRGAYQDSDHKSFWNRNSHYYWTRQEQNHFSPEIVARFQEVEMQHHFPNDWCRENRIGYITSLLMAVKPGNEFFGMYGWPR